MVFSPPTICLGAFDDPERIGLVAYKLRLPEELNSVHDTFHVSNIKKCLADGNLHVSLDEIKVDKTLHFVEGFTGNHDDQLRIKYPQLFVSELLSQLVKSRDEISSRRGYYDIRDLIRLVILLEMAKSSFV
ncbi:hypothetical protein Tco_0612453 [Tanacetum coccineum]